MSNKPIFPVFVFEDGGFYVFLNQSDLGSYLEHYDVSDDVYSGYDYKGRQLVFHIDVNQEVYCTAENEEADNEDLMRRIETWLSLGEYGDGKPRDAEIAKALAVGVYCVKKQHSPFLTLVKRIFNK